MYFKHTGQWHWWHTVRLKQIHQPSARQSLPLVQKSNSLYTEIQSILQNSSVIAHRVCLCVFWSLTIRWALLSRFSMNSSFWKRLFLINNLGCLSVHVKKTASRQFINIKVRENKRKIEADCLCRIVQILETDFMQRGIKRDFRRRF